MTQPNVEDPNLEGAGGDQPPVSPEQGKSIAGAPNSSQEFLELKQGYVRLERELKGLQSRQDKDKNEVQRFMEDVKAHVAKGLSLDEAEQAVNQSRKAEAKDDLLYRIAQKVGVLDGSPQTVAGNGRKAADEVADVFAEYNVDPNDPDAAPLLELQGADLIKGVSKLALKRAKPNVPDSSEATAVSGSQPKPPGIEAATRQYQEDMLKNRGNRSALKAIKEKAIKAGVPVDTIVFT